MYSSTYSPSSSSPYTSPPQQPIDPYRSSPIQVATKQPYNLAFSPPPQMPSAYSSMQPAPASGQIQRFQQYPPAVPQQYARSAGVPPSSSRYASPSQSQVYPNGYPSQSQPQPAHHPPPPQRHKGTLAPGQIVKVGDIAVRIERYLSEGGYAHVYLTTSEKPVYPPSRSGEKKGRWGEKGYTEHCLKRIAFEDESVWVDVKKEIEVMKSLPTNPHLVQYLGHAHSRLPTGGHEVFILMEFCSGGGIIDLLNKRLRDRLKEIEILNIFTDVCEAVAAMHYLPQPLLHRDLKIENVLSQPTSTSSTSQRPSPLTFKLCDFGSTTFPASKPPATKLEADASVLDLNKHTTLQYRSPEMVEPMLGLPVGLPSDVWALGCLLYKLCYYTTPFEEHGPLAIVNAKYTFPPVPGYSPKLQHLIASMLVEQPHRRPSVFEILRVAHEMSGTKPEVDYPIQSRSFPGSSQQGQSSRPTANSSNLLDFTGHPSHVDKTPVLQPNLASTVQPQRRGRPTREPSQKQVTQSPAQAQANNMPPMPVPPAQPQTTSISFEARKQGLRPQVTGEKPTSPGLDAFGMPTVPTSSSQKFERGFGDSFAAPKPSASTGASRFGANLPRPPSGFGDSFELNQPGLVSSRSPPKADLKRAPSSVSKQTSKPVSPMIAPKPVMSKPDVPPSSATNGEHGEHTFETRFPSIEDLDAREETPQPSSQTSKPEKLVSPVTSPSVARPAFNAKLSVMGNMTGGDMQSPVQPTASMFDNQHPQPRSTHVTGTAFKGIQGGMQSPSTSKTDYFGSATSASRPQESPAISTASAVKSPVPEDLMGGDDTEGLQVPSIQPGRSTTPISPSSATSRLLPSPGLESASYQPLASPGSVGSAKVAPSTGHHRALLPNIDASKPSSNIMSAEWSPLERLRNQGTPSENKREVPNLEIDSSDEEIEPESASGSGRRPTWPPRDDVAPQGASSPQESSHRFSAYSSSRPSQGTAAKASTVSIPPTSSTSRPGTQRGLSGERSRPQSMFITPSSSSAMSKSPSTLLSPPLPVSEEPSALPRSGAGRPTHGRQKSITDMVSKYEQMKPPSATMSSSFGSRKSPQMDSASGFSSGQSASAGTSSVAIGGLGRKPSIANKPSVASKPQALRKSTMDERATSSSASAQVSSPPSPVKPKTSVKPTIVAPKRIRHDQTPAPAGYSRSSSGRSFPITKPKPQLPLDIPTSDSASGLSQPGAGGGSGNEAKTSTEHGGHPPSQTSRNGNASPEKQQPVNLLIQRWNQGQTSNAAANKGPPKKGGYI